MTAKVRQLRQRADWEDRLLRGGKDDRVLSIVANATTILSHSSDWAGKVGWDSFSNEIVVLKPPPWDADDAPARFELGAWSEQDDVRLSSWLSRRWGIRLTPAAARSAVDVVARRNERHPVREYLAGLTWDGTPRVRTWLTSYLGVEASPYSEMVGTITLVSAVARIIIAGCKADCMTVLEGAQGKKKSTVIRTLFGEAWTSDTPPDLASKDRFVALRGRWCVEWSELDGLERGEVNRVKGFLSSAVDDYRAPYARGNVRVPRQCIFVGTVNGDAYLRDVTGNRRFLPVSVGNIDIAAVERDRDQLWAEAAALYHDGAVWWPEGEIVEACREEQAQRVATDAWDDAIAVFVDGKGFVTVADVLTRAFGVEPAEHDQVRQNRAARALLKLGWVPTRRRVDGRRTYGYSPRVLPGLPSNDEGGTP